MREDNAAALAAALTGVELGDQDQAILDWLAGWEASTVATVCSWLDGIRRLAVPEAVEYGCRWTDWEDWTSPGGKTRVRYDRGGYGDTGRLTAGLIAAQTRAWQPHHGLPADAVVVCRPVGEWAVVEDKQKENQADG